MHFLNSLEADYWIGLLRKKMTGKGFLNQLNNKMKRLLSEIKKYLFLRRVYINPDKFRLRITISMSKEELCLTFTHMKYLCFIGANRS